MQIATEVRRGYIKDPNSVSSKNFKIDFKMVTRKATVELTPEEEQRVIAESKSVWLGIVSSVPNKPEK